MPTIAEQLTQLESDRQDLVSNLQTKGITGLTGDETFTALVPEVLNIQTGGGSAVLDSEIEGSATSITSNATSVRIRCFQQYANLVDISLPNATIIGLAAFLACTNLENVSIPLAQEIGSSAFAQCSSLVNIDLPSVTIFKDGSNFMSCSSLQSITLSNPSVVTLENSNIFTSVSQKVTIYVPSNLISNYQYNTNWNWLYSNGEVDFVAIPE